ncbi:RNA polymerase sigma-70 factor [Mucilaginibacter pedocola]|uniref:RNA polymerase sigma-70 factor n=1 Tax=Mucilaginibacter pedocola TaxID=1792845 RepID=A0A1S9PDH7_9SPHI|nr:RNA polymerase sigma-70 factor [Mucilaginibacter pedocola]
MTATTFITRESFEQIYNRYWDKVYAVCYNNTREHETSREMVQDIFRSLWERRAELQINTIEQFLVRSAKYKAFEFIRNKTTRERHLEIKFQNYQHASNCTEERVLFNNLSETVTALVDKLPEQCKRVFKMSREKGLSNKEIASELLISERAVEYHITRALKTLKTGLQPYHSY